MAVEVRPAKLAFGEQCPQCSARQEYRENRQCHQCRLEFTKEVDVTTGLVVEEPAPKPPPGSKKYKVLTQRDERFKVIGITATDVGSWLGSFAPRGGGAARQELVVQFERD